MGFAVRNLKKVGGFPIHIFIPAPYNPIYKIYVETATETIDITDSLLEGSYTDGITETIGNFELRIDNSAMQYTGRINLYDRLKIYLDYGTEATTLVFTGLIERPSNSNGNMILTGRSSAARTIGKLVTYSTTSTARSTILKEIVTKYFSGVITVTNVQDDTGLATVNYNDKPFWECVEELCSAGSYDAYIDANFDLHYFPSGSITNETEAIVHDVNLIETGDFSPDMQSIINRVKVYGANSGNIQILATAEDLASQTSYDIKESKVDDTSLITIEEAQVRANFELSKNVEPVIVGTVESLMLPTLQPGERLRISDTMNGLNPTTEGYTIQKFTHKFSNDDPPMTEVTVQKERSSIPQILKKRIKFEYTISDAYNPNEMDYSYVNYFNTDSGIHDGTFITSGYLTNTAISDSWISLPITLQKEATYFESRIESDDNDSVQIFISVDSGSTYTYLPNNTQITLSPSSSMLVKVIFGAVGTKVETIGIYYK